MVSEWTYREMRQKERDLGTCRPPTKEMNRDSRFTIPVGTSVMVRKVVAGKWRSWKTRKKLEFERYESYKRHTLVFREAGFLIRVVDVSVLVLAAGCENAEITARQNLKPTLTN
jgi:hypothetical protein